MWNMKKTMYFDYTIGSRSLEKYSSADEDRINERNLQKLGYEFAKKYGKIDIKYIYMTNDFYIFDKLEDLKKHALERDGDSKPLYQKRIRYSLDLLDSRD